MRTLIACASVLAALAGPSFAQTLATADTALGPVLVGDTGMTLYTFRKDTPGVTNCYDQCAVNWPPLIVKSGTPAAPYSLVERTDGSLQLAKDGMPLYYWIKDTKPGDTTGDGVNDAWDVARP